MNWIKILSILVLILGFLQCGSLKQEKNPPFKIQSAIYTVHSGNQPGIKVTNIKIIYTSHKKIEFDSIYFSKRIVKMESHIIKGQKMIIGYFNTSILKRNLVLDANSIKEMNNEIPNIKKFPFKLNENEAMLSYKIHDKIKYFKIKSIKRRISF